MNLITEKNLSKTIIFTFIIIMTSMIFAISYFYVKNTYDNFEQEMDKFVNEYYLDKKKTLIRINDKLRFKKNKPILNSKNRLHAL